MIVVFSLSALCWRSIRGLWTLPHQRDWLRQNWVLNWSNSEIFYSMAKWFLHVLRKSRLKEQTQSLHKLINILVWQCTWSSVLEYKLLKMSLPGPKLYLIRIISLEENFPCLPGSLWMSIENSIKILDSNSVTCIWHRYCHNPV